MTEVPDAPISVDDLVSVLTDDFGTARTLPPPAYLSDAVLDWERRRIFEGSWLCIGRTELPSEPRSQIAVEVMDQGVLLVRDEHGVMRGFHNTCRHRGHELLGVGECRQKGAIVCPYHSWAYFLDGRLRGASRFKASEGFDPAEFSLLPVAVAEWNGWTFVNLSGDAGPLDDWLGALTPHVADWELDRLVVGASSEYTVAANWKVILENFVECYHCPSIHPELCRVADPETGNDGFVLDQMWLGGPMQLRDGVATQSLDGRSGARFRRLDERHAREVAYYAVFPNLLISPHPDYVMTHRLLPVSPTETHVECAWLFSPEAVSEPGFDASFASDFWDRTNSQDFAACESVMRGMQSLGYRPGPFDQREVIVHAVQVMLAGAYLGGRLRPPRMADLPEQQSTTSKVG